ncbi:MAG: hypothetical protein ACRD3V_03540 [Vicinamibacteria bacterium]
MELSSKRILLTAGSGFLGRRVLQALLAEGVREVVVPRKADYDLTEAFGFEAKTSFRDGLEKTIRWFRESRAGGRTVTGRRN